MKRFFTITTLFTLLAMVGCNRPRLIPDQKLGSIFHDAMLVNAYLKIYSETTIDSMNIYEPIFDSYGYTAEDVQYTIDKIARRKNVRVSDIAELMISQLEDESIYLNTETAKLDTIANVANRRYTHTILEKSDIVTKNSADSVLLTYFIEPVLPGTYSIEGAYLLDSLDDETGRRYRIYYELADSTERQVSNALLVRRREAMFSQEAVVDVADTSLRRLVIDFYHFNTDSEKRRPVPKMTIQELRVRHTPPVDENVYRLFDEQTQMRIFADTLINIIEGSATK